MTQHELEVICRNGEGQYVEFKRNLNSDLSRELVAFANAEGGRIFIGVDDGGKVVGAEISNEIRSRVEVMARDCDPAVAIRLEVCGNVLIVNVPEGKDKPYRSSNGFYLRTGASSVKLTTQEILEFGQNEGRIKFDDISVSGMNLVNELDENALKRFNLLSGISAIVDSTQILENLGVLTVSKGSTVLNNAGALFFSKQPTRHLPHAIISCVLFKGIMKNYVIDRKVLEFDLLTNIDQAVAFLERNLRLAYEIKDIRRKEILEIPKDVLREAVINACAHRDYFERGANVVVEIFDDRVEISNPGGLPKKLKPQHFGRYSIARNPLITGLLHRCEYIEKAGTGIQRMRMGMKDAGLLEPVFEFSGFFTVTFYRGKALPGVLKAELKVRPDKLQRIIEVLRILYAGERLDVESLANRFRTTSRNIRKDLDHLKQMGWIVSSGLTNRKIYELTALGKLKAGSIKDF